MKIKENKTFFLMQFGDTPQLRVLDFLIGFHFFDYPLTEIARESNVSYNSLKAFLSKTFMGKLASEKYAPGASPSTKSGLSISCPASGENTLTSGLSPLSHNKNPIKTAIIIANIIRIQNSFLIYLSINIIHIYHTF